MPPFVDPNTVQVPTVGVPASVAWGQVVRDDLVELARRVVRAEKYTLGTITCASSAAWANVPGLGALVLPSVVVGDWLEVSVNFAWNNEAIQGFLDAASIVAGAPVNHWACAGAPANIGADGWVGDASVYARIGGSIVKQAVAGDIEGGNVTIRLRYRTSAAGNKTMPAIPDLPFMWHVKNLGQ